ncbi:hypothetical protein ACVWZ8_000289 [Arthrobacter sp. UYCu723]
MGGNREPEVVRGARGAGRGAGSGATVADVARLLATVRPCNLDSNGGAGCGRYTGQLGTLTRAWACFGRRLILSDPFGRL